MDKAQEVFEEPLSQVGGRLQLFQCDVGNEEALTKACEGADAAVWCVSEATNQSSLKLESAEERGLKALGKAFAAASSEPRVVRVSSAAVTRKASGLKALGKAFAATRASLRRGIERAFGLKASGKASAAARAEERGLEAEQAWSQRKSTPRVVMVSSAAVTRPTWSEEKRARLSGCADIPIVRLNPQGILDKKRRLEGLLRNSGAPYTVVRPVGLNDDHPPGRPLIVQGDVAVGRISRADLASLVARLLVEPDATGKTFETLAVAGYPKPASYARSLSALRQDGSSQSPGEEAMVAASYDLLQQLLPGEKQDSAALAMGQTYEQRDSGTEGRLGPRGGERVPESVA